MSWFSPSRGAMRLMATLFALALVLSPVEGAAQLVLPVIISHPQSQTVALGSDVTFSITVTNTASLPLTNFLRRAGVSIATNIANERFASFTLRNVQTNAARTYTIGVLNALAGRQSSNATLTIVTQVVTAGYSFASESCLPANGALDPGETVTLHFALSATNGYAATNLVATLEETNGVVAPSGPQTYGVLAADGTSVLRPFTFTANGTCGGQVRATLRLFDGSNDWGRVTFVLPLGITTANGPECCTANLADLAVSISDQPEVLALASNLTWTITVTNRGPETAHNVVVTNRLAPELMYLSAQAGAGACAVQQDRLMCQLGELPANTSWPITITTLVNAMGTGSITNRAGVTSAQADSNWADNVSATHATRLVQPSVRVSNTTVDEGESGTSYAIFNVRLSFPSQRVVTLQYATADDTATAGDDYLPQSGTITYPPGVTEQQIIVIVLGDAEPEPDEVFRVELQSAIDAGIVNALGSCVILSDDKPTFAQNAVQKLWSVTSSNFLTVGVAVDALGNAYSAGALRNISAGGTNLDYGLIKYGPDGSQIWLARYGRNEFGQDEQPIALTVAPLGDAYVTGSAGTVKFDANGNQLWISTNVFGTACALDGEGNFCVTGGKLAGGIPEITTSKLGSDGTVIWQTSYTNALGTNEQAVVLASGRDGSVFVLAGRFSGHSLLIKYDRNGDQLWVDSQFFNYPTSLAIDLSGDVCIAYHLDPSLEVGVRKISGNTGVQMWSSLVDGYLSLGSCKIAIDNANNIYVTHTVEHDSRDFAAVFPVTLKLDQYGNTLWRTRFIKTDSDIYCYATDMIVDPVGNVYITGLTAVSTIWPNGSRDAHIAWMLDADGYRRWVDYSEGAWMAYPRFPQSPYLALGASGTIWMAGQRRNASGLVALLPYARAGVPEFYAPLTLATNNNGAVSLSASVVGDSLLSYQWTSSTRRLFGATNASLSSYWFYSRYDFYSVTVANDLGSVGSPDFEWSPPQLFDSNRQPFPMAVATGEPILLSSKFSGALDLQWYLNSTPIVGATNWYYSFTNAQPAMAGDFYLAGRFPSKLQPWLPATTSQVTRVTIAAQLQVFPSAMVVTNVPDVLSASARDSFGNEWVTEDFRTYGFTTKYNSEGARLWRVPFWGQQISVDSSGNAYLVSANYDERDLFVVKLGVSGELLWTSRYSSYENGREVVTAFLCDEFGNTWIAGYTQVYYSRGRDEDGHYIDGADYGTDRPFILRYNPEGTLTWSLSRELADWHSIVMPREPGPFLNLSAEGDLLVSGRGFGNVRYHEVPVAGLPELVSRPMDRVANADEPVTLAVSAQGQGPMYYHWRKDGVYIPGATNATLEFSAVQFEDAGDYSVEIRNQLGTILTPEARLTVQSPPKIRQQPQDALVVAGGRVTFSAGVAGNAPLRYQWRFNDVPLVSATNVSLVISNVTPAVTGLYTLVVTNAYGASTSAPARLEIWRPPVVEDSVGRTNVPLGGSIELSIAATGTPPLRYQWRRNGVNIPSATNFTYTINNARLSDGGTYTVLVANGIGAVISDPILVIIEVPQQPPGDHFVNRTLVTGVTNAVGGTNRWATREVGEPLHAGKYGSNSVWYRWVAPVSGIATFRTVGSTFDTLLGIYTGTNVAELAAVAEDEDRGGFFTSELRFNAEQGTDYAIAIDGFFGQQGSFILTWEVETTAQSLPVVITQPHSQTVRAGAGVLLQVAATGAGLTYQWHFNGTRIAGATGAALAVNNVRPPDVGFYTVAITNNAGRGIESLPAAIEIGPVSGVQGQDKLENLFGDTPPAGGIVAAALPSTFISVSAGTVDYHITSTRDATSQSWEPNHCGVIGGASKWFEFHATDDATVAIDTRGSTFDTVLAVYRKVGVLHLAQNRIDCSTDWQPGAPWSRVSFQAQRNASYYVVVDGANVNDLTGRAQLNWAMGQQPVIATAPQYDFVRPGQRWRFSAGVTNAVPPPTYRWYHNGHPIAGATNDWFELASLQLTNAGFYSVAVSNALGTVEQLIAQLSVPTLTSELRTSDGAYQLTLAPVDQPGTTMLLESSTNLVDWTPVQTHTNTTSSVTLTLPLNSAQRFFRTRPVQ